MKRVKIKEVDERERARSRYDAAGVVQAVSREEIRVWDESRASSFGGKTPADRTSLGAISAPLETLMSESASRPSTGIHFHDKIPEASKKPVAIKSRDVFFKPAQLRLLPLPEEKDDEDADLKALSQRRNARVIGLPFPREAVTANPMSRVLESPEDVDMEGGFVQSERK